MAVNVVFDPLIADNIVFDECQNWRLTSVNTGVALFCLLAGFMLVIFTMPENASTWLALLSSP